MGEERGGRLEVVEGSVMVGHPDAGGVFFFL
jgi:hypothetical protein